MSVKAVRVKDIMGVMEEIAPKKLAENWDKPGLAIGDPEREVKKILVALDVIDPVVEEAKRIGADMIVTHHPMLLFRKIESITADTLLGKRIFNLIQNLSQTVIVPIAGLIITFVLCYELITMVTQKNNFHEFETYNIFLWIFKAYVAIYLVTNTFNITMAVFDVGQHVVNNAAGVISGNTAVDATEAISRIVDALEDMELGDLFLLSMETMLISVTMHILSIIITVILYGRMIEIYLYTSIAPIPFATMTNKEWGNIGNNYLKGLFALAFQGFFMMVCVGIYAVLVNAMTISSDLHAAMFSVAAYTVILAFSLFKTGSLSKSIFNAH